MGLSTLLLLLLLVVAFSILTRGITPIRAALLGSVWALGVFDRPNYLALLPALLYAFARAPVTHSSSARNPYGSPRTLALAGLLFAVSSRHLRLP